MSELHKVKQRDKEEENKGRKDQRGVRAWSSVVTRKNPSDLSIHRASVMLDHVHS